MIDFKIWNIFLVLVDQYLKYMVYNLYYEWYILR